MAAPFGGHPTFGAYLVWARDVHGFRAQTGFGADPDGRSHTVTRISKTDGPTVVVVGVDQKEHLTPTMVGNLDRRLGVTSPFFSLNGDE